MLGAVSAVLELGREFMDRVMTQRLSAVASEDVTRLDERRKTHFLSRPADGYAMILESVIAGETGISKGSSGWIWPFVASLTS